MNYWSYIGIIAVAYIGYRFLSALGKRLPFIELLLLIAGMQWIVGSAIEYRTEFQHFKYYMYVDEFTYMSYVVPAYILLSFFALFKTLKYNLDNEAISSLSKYSKYGIYIVVVGVLSEIVRSFVPASLGFIFFLLANLKYVGAIILFFSVEKRHRYVFYFTLIYLVLSALRSGFFHDLILISVFFFMFWCLNYKPSFKLKVTVIILGFVLSTIIQVVKSDYRILIGSGNNTNYVSLFLEVLNRRVSGGFTEDTDEQSELNVRLNQGWIISAIMDYTPRVESYAKGETIKSALFASALPRFLNPNKKIAGGVENFERFTGIPLAKNTSMGMSLVGEGYANFGRHGVWFMAAWGFFLARFWNLIIKFSKDNKVVIFFLPLIFLQVVKAETELVVVLNHLVKASILVIIILYFSKKFLRKRIADA